MTLSGLSADAEKTNGYVTFTKSTDDNVSYTQETLSIDTTDYTDISETKSNTSRNTAINIRANQLTPYADKKLFGTNVRIEYKPNADAEFEEIAYDKMDGLTPIRFYYGNNNWIRYVWYGDAIFSDTGAANKRFTEWAQDGTTNLGWRDSITLENITRVQLVWPARDHQDIFPKFQFDESATNPLVIRITLVCGEIPLIANFKLNINEFKSQQGDIGELGKRANTVNIAGTLSDSTPFEYNAVIK